MSALVYGGRSPIALALCGQLATAGHQVHLVTRTRDQAILKLGNDFNCAEIYACDLQDSVASIALADKIDEEVGGLDAVAFVHRYRGEASTPLVQYAVEVYTPYQVLEALANRGRSHECAVVLTTSPGAHHVLADQDFQYHASKAALAQLVRFGAARFASRGLRVNGLSPGSLIFKERAASFYAENPQIVNRANNLVPLSRMGVVSEIASVATFLLSKQSSYLNGQILEVDGGLSTLDPASLSKPN